LLLEGKVTADVRFFPASQSTTNRYAFRIGRDLEAMALHNKRAKGDKSLSAEDKKKLNWATWVKNHLTHQILKSYANKLLQILGLLTRQNVY